MTTLFDDLVHACRVLRQSPAYVVSVVAVLALAMGGSTAVFSILQAVILRPLPYDDPDRLAVIWGRDERRDLPDGVSFPDYHDWRRRSRTFVDMALYFRPPFTERTIEGGSEPRRVEVAAVTSNFFDVLGAEPMLGRGFDDADVENATATVVIGHGFWLQEFTADRAIIGRSLEIGGESLEIVGVMPAGFSFPTSSTALWVHAGRAPMVPGSLESRGFDGWVGLGRIGREVTLAEAQAELDDISDQLAAEYPETHTDRGVRLTGLLEHVAGVGTARSLWLLFGATGLVVLIAATNVAHLTLVRAMARRRELAIRAALGASGNRLARQQVIETVTLAVISAAAGIATASLLLRGLLTVAPPLARIDQVALHPGVLFGAVVGSVVLGFGLALVPAWSAGRSAPLGAMREGERGLESAGRRRLRASLVTGQVAMAMVLLSGSALFMRSLQNATNEDPGFDASSKVVARLHIDSEVYREPATRHAFYEQLVARLAAESEIDRVGLIEDFFMFRIPDLSLTVEGVDPDGGANAPASADAVHPGFFAAVEAPMVSGREFLPEDLDAEIAPTRVVINETAARAFWPGQRAVGKRFKWGAEAGDDRPWVTVIGVARDMRREGLDVAPVAQFFTAGLGTTAEVAVSGRDPGTTAETLRRVVRDLDATAPLSRLRVVDQWFSAALAPRKFRGLLIAGFAALASVLAPAGLFALLHQAILQRRRELGIRLALGAEPGNLVRLVVSQALRLALLGIALGAIGAYSLSGAVGALLYGITATDPGTLAVVALALLAVAVLASAIPAFRVTRIRPNESLVPE